MKGLGAFVDTETTGLRTSDEVIEFAIVLFSYDISRDGLTAKDTYQEFREPNYAIDTGAEAVHGIPIDEVRSRSLKDKVIRRMLRKADFVVAHSADFDRRFVERLYPKTEMMRWFCSMNGVNWKEKAFGSKRLQQLLSDHGIAVNQRHQALDDVLASLELLAHVDPLSGRMHLADLLPLAISTKKRSCCRWLLIAFLIVGFLLTILLLSVLFSTNGG